MKKLGTALEFISTGISNKMVISQSIFLIEQQTFIRETKMKFWQLTESVSPFLFIMVVIMINLFVLDESLVSIGSPRGPNN